MHSLLRQIQTQCLGNNRSLPSTCYTSADIFALEQQRIFAAGWVCIGREDEIPSGGDYFTTHLFDEPLLVTRDHKKEIQVLSNVCRHRGMRLAKGRGHADKLRCPYHAWSYDLDGQLRNAPLMGNLVDKKTCRLPGISSQCWSGFIFAKPKLTPNRIKQTRQKRIKPTAMVDSGGDLETLLAPLQSQIAGYHVEQMQHLACFEEVWNCNWKCLVENFMDGYHLSVVHPQTLRHLTPTNLCKKSAAMPAFTSYCAHYPESAPERSGGNADLTDVQRRQSILFCVFPSLVVSVSVDSTVYLSMQPRGTDQVAVKWALATASTSLSAQEKQDLIDKWLAINAEDHAILEQLYAGLKSEFFPGGPLAPADFEGTVADFQDYWVDRMCVDLPACGGDT